MFTGAAAGIPRRVLTIRQPRPGLALLYWEGAAAVGATRAADINLMLVWPDTHTVSIHTPPQSAEHRVLL